MSILDKIENTVQDGEQNESASSGLLTRRDILKFGTAVGAAMLVPDLVAGLSSVNAQDEKQFPPELIYAHISNETELIGANAAHQGFLYALNQQNEDYPVPSVFATSNESEFTEVVELIPHLTLMQRNRIANSRLEHMFFRRSSNSPIYRIETTSTQIGEFIYGYVLAHMVGDDPALIAQYDVSNRINLVAQLEVSGLCNWASAAACARGEDLVIGDKSFPGSVAHEVGHDLEDRIRFDNYWHREWVEDDMEGRIPDERRLLIVRTRNRKEDTVIIDIDKERLAQGVPLDKCSKVGFSGFNEEFFADLVRNSAHYSIGMDPSYGYMHPSPERDLFLAVCREVSQKENEWRYELNDLYQNAKVASYCARLGGIVMELEPDFLERVTSPEYIEENAEYIEANPVYRHILESSFMENYPIECRVGYLFVSLNSAAAVGPTMIDGLEKRPYLIQTDRTDVLYSTTNEVPVQDGFSVCWLTDLQYEIYQLHIETFPNFLNDYIENEGDAEIDQIISSALRGEDVFTEQIIENRELKGKVMIGILGRLYLTFHRGDEEMRAKLQDTYLPFCHEGRTIHVGGAKISIRDVGWLGNFLTEYLSSDLIEVFGERIFVEESHIDFKSDGLAALATNIDADTAVSFLSTGGSNSEQIQTSNYKFALVHLLLPMILRDLFISRMIPLPESVHVSENEIQGSNIFRLNFKLGLTTRYESLIESLNQNNTSEDSDITKRTELFDAFINNELVEFMRIVGGQLIQMSMDDTDAITEEELRRILSSDKASSIEAGIIVFQQLCSRLLEDNPGILNNQFISRSIQNRIEPTVENPDFTTQDVRKIQRASTVDNPELDEIFAKLGIEVVEVES